MDELSQVISAFQYQKRPESRKTKKCASRGVVTPVLPGDPCLITYAKIKSAIRMSFVYLANDWAHCRRLSLLCQKLSFLPGVLAFD